MKNYITRFVNIVNVVNIPEIWRVVKKIRSESEFQRVCNTFESKTLYTDSDIQLNVRAVEEELKINSSDAVFENITKDQMKVAAEMFVYLNFCPDSLKAWFLFYNDLFENKSSDVIILTLNRILKSGETNQNKASQILNIFLLWSR